VALEVCDCLLDRPRPNKAQIAVAGCDRHRRTEAVEAGTVHVQLPVAEPVAAGPLVALLDLGAEDVAVEGVRPLPVRHGDDAVVDPQAEAQRATSIARDSRITITLT
jgi:hypothetical protein